MKARNTYANLKAPEKAVWRHLRLNLPGPFEEPMYRFALGTLCQMLAEGRRQGRFTREMYRLLRDFTCNRRQALQILEGLSSPPRTSR